MNFVGNVPDQDVRHAYTMQAFEVSPQCLRSVPAYVIDAYSAVVDNASYPTVPHPSSC
jgi:hypothetical protein